MKVFFVISMVGILFLASCSKFTSQNESYETAAEPAPAARSLEAGVNALALDNSADAPLDIPAQSERKRIKNAFLQIQVEDVEAAERVISRDAMDVGGWIVSSDFSWGEVTLVVKVPAESYENFLNTSEALGTVESKSVSTDDVTEYYFDLKNRIANKTILRDRFREYLKTAKSMEDILSVERQLNEVTMEIERLEGTFRGLNRDIDYSTVTFQLTPPVTETVSKRIPSFYRAFSTLGYKVLSFLYYLLFGVIYLVIFGVPLVLVLGFIFVLGWGRIGFIRRFFGRLKK